jgi:hypothetical protein
MLRKRVTERGLMNGYIREEGKGKKSYKRRGERREEGKHYSVMN